MRKTETIEVSKDADAIGNRVRVKVVKNKVAPPFRKTEIEMMFGKGVSATGSFLDCAVKYDIIKKSGAWYSYNDEKIGQGRDNARDYLEQNPEFLNELENKLRKIIFPGREFPQAKPGSKAKGILIAETAQNTKDSVASPNAEPANMPVNTATEAAEPVPVYETETSHRGRPKKNA